MLLLGVLLIIAGASVALPTSEIIIYDLEEAESHFEEFIDKFERHYDSEEEKEMRFELFKNNLRQINELNAQRTKDYHATHGITNFADYTQEEFKGLLGLLPSDPNIKMEVVKVTDTDYPTEVDWSKKGKVTSVKDQGHCGSCWAFAGIGNIESQYAIKYNKSLDLSVQQVLDCDKSDQSCMGGGLEGAAWYVYRQEGVELSIDYPYVGKFQSCNADKKKFKVKVSGSHKYRITNEIEDFKKLLNEQGPVVIGVNTDKYWRTNTGGIIDNPTKDFPEHAVLLVGYGIEKNITYWIIKNSWGTSFGNKGYARVRAGNNSCNIMYAGANTATVV